MMPLNHTLRSPLLAPHCARSSATSRRPVLVANELDTQSEIRRGNVENAEPDACAKGRPGAPDPKSSNHVPALCAATRGPAPQSDPGRRLTSQSDPPAVN